MEAQILEFKAKADPCQKEYDRIIDMVAELFALTPGETEKMRSNNISRIVVKLPFLAKCRNPERTALSHIIITYAASHHSCKAAFLHNIYDDEDLFRRLECINHFDGGDPKVIKSGMNLLALLMLADHENDRDLDFKQNKYNPMTAGAWSSDEIQSRLLKEIRELGCPEMAYLPGDDDVRQGFWEFP